WVQGSSDKIGFVNNHTVCYPCGNYIIFVDIETKKRTVLECQTGQVGAFAVNGNSEVVAFSDRKLNPFIYIYAFPELNKVTELKGSDAQLDYTLLAFSFTGPYLASYSSIPEFVLSVWNWQENILLCSESQPGVTATSLSFNPMNWQQLCFVNESSLTIWDIERNNEDHYLKQKPVKLPDEEGSVTPHEDLFSPGSHSENSYYGPVLPISALAGLVGDEAETFMPRDVIKPSVHPTVHCWTATSEIYMGCEEGQILAINAETLNVSFLQQGPLPVLLDGKLKDLEKRVVLSMAFCKDGLYTAGNEGIVFHYDIKGLQYEMTVCTDILQPISSLIFCPDYTILLIVTMEGTIYTYKPGHKGEAVKLLDACSSCFLSADFLTPGNEYCVSVAISGEVQVWLLEDGTCVSKLNLDTEENITESFTATAMACCPSSNSVAVGTKKGEIYFIDITEVETPRVVHRIFLSKFPVLSLDYDQTGQFLICRATQGHIFILDARPSTLFQVLGYIVLADEVHGLSVVSDFRHDLVEVVVLLKVAEVQRARLEIFCLPSGLTTDNEKYVNEQGMLKASAIKMEQYDLDYPLSSAVKLKDNVVYGYCGSAPFICKYHLSEEVNLSVFLSEKRTPSKQFGPGSLFLSPNSRWLASAAEDGVLFIYHTFTMDVIAQKHCHSYQGGGIRSVVFSLDGKFMLVNGVNDGALVCLKWKRIKKIEKKEAAFHWRSLLAILNQSTFNENAVLKSMPEWKFEPESTTESLPEERFEVGFFCFFSFFFFSSCVILSFNNVFVVCQVMREETQKFANQKKELKMAIKKLRKNIQKMMHENEQMPDTEKLEQQEFNLDIEEQERVQAEAEQEVARLRKEIDMENLANCYLQDVIKRECWDSMCVKGRAVKCFHIACEVKNYPLKERSKEELETLEKILQLKKIEAVDLKVRKEIVEIKPETELPKEEEEMEEEVVTDNTASYSLVGSLSSQYGADISVLYNQLDLHTREQKVNQIILLQDIIYKVKTAFNKEFDIAVQQKEHEIARVKERNLRIREILAQLDLQEEVWEPALTDDEVPERALTVQDSEIKAEKYLTPQERAKAEMLAKLEMERQLAALNNERLRALKDMMGGVLEVKKEDILKIDIPPPSFISKSESVWNEEEKKMFREYEKKVQELNEEREKHKRALEAELKKLQASIQETTQSFDETMCKLFERKVNSEMVIYQEELKIINILYSLLLDEELDTREAELHHFLKKKRKEKVKSTKTIQCTNRKIDAYIDTYENAIAEDKILESDFRKDFADIPAYLLDKLFKLYRRRPRIQKMKMLLDTASPYGDHSGSAEDYQEGLNLLMKAMDELDKPEHMPNGLDPSLWDRFCLARRNKVESEQLVKLKALTLADMQAFLQRRIDEDEKMKSEIGDIFQELTWLREEKMKLQLNLTVQFLLKQGQVELESTELPDFTDAILINKSVIEELNCTIMAEGEKKIASMVECKDFSKGIFQLEWEHKKMKMQIEDLKQKARDILTLRVSKDHQLFLTVLNYDSRVTHQVSVMEQTLAVMDELHQKKVKNCQKIIKELEKCISLKEQANYKLSLELQEMLVSVSEREHIFKAADTQLVFEEIAQQRYQDIVRQKKLRDNVKKQEEQFRVLQAETERLKLRTLPMI
ncbi:CFA43 protein, partial [Nothocercus nigrocapillus]|nr:CFA43 protein [Nothocercus nigrocapillus]